MAQKAAKQQAARNTSILNRTHLISLAINAFFILLRLVLFQASSTRTTYLLYGILSLPAFVIEFWFERIGRPLIASNGELKKSGEDLEAKGLTDYMWDVLYWTWGCTITAAVFGNKAWYGWIMVPLYSAWLAWTTVGGMRQGMAGMAEKSSNAEGLNSSTSNRQKKREKRGDQKYQYR
ncbi:MAG: hypothetical protein LQ352_007918 [Teloschistes flavicans]|nr:MAG: hypothetical protein LQ352_007918 [Teloschistes flavicans]